MQKHARRYTRTLHMQQDGSEAAFVIIDLGHGQVRIGANISDFQVGAQLPAEHVCCYVWT